MQLTIDTNELTELDVAILTALIGGEAEAAPAPPAAKAPAKRAPAKAAKAEPEDDAAPTLKDAVDLASKLVSGGDAAKVKAALTDLGVAKVSQLEEGDIASFIEALNE